MQRVYKEEIDIEFGGMKTTDCIFTDRYLTHGAAYPENAYIKLKIASKVYSYSC